MAFDEVLFPVAISKGSSTGPTLRFDVVEFDSGEDARIAKWPQERRQWNAGVGIQASRSFAQLEQVYKFYLSRDGIMRGFRYQDPIDFSSASDLRGTPARTDQVLGQGDGTTSIFQLKRTINDGFNSKVRTITKPRLGSVLVDVAGVLKTEGTHYTVDYSTGQIQFTAGNIPTGAGTPQVVSAGFLFDCPAQFSTELQSLEILLGEFEQGQVPDIPIQEMLGDVVTPAQWPRGGSSSVSLSVDMLYDYAMGATVAFTPSTAGLGVTLPDRSSVEMGAPIFHFFNESPTNSLAFKVRSDGSTSWTLPASTGCVVCLIDILGTRTWKALKGVA